MGLTRSRYLGFAIVALAGFMSAAPTGGACTPAPTTQTKVVAANDLGMHCVDKEFSVFSILPPYNVIQAQVLQTDASGFPQILTDAKVKVTYSAVADAGGSINTTSLGNKTAFWNYAQALFGVVLQPGQGLQGLYMPADAPTPGPQALHFDSATSWFRADGIPITPTDDAHNYNPYPLLRITAIDKATNTELAHTDVVVPVSTETDCQNCHATGGIATEAPGVTWSNDPDLEKQSKLNILILHDHSEGTNLIGSQPVLCASCHYSAALDLAGAGPQGPQVGKPTSSAVAHDFHGRQLHNGVPVFPSNGDANSTCYQCHPGAITQCDRGAMKTGGMECRDCHGDMLSVGGAYTLAVGGSMDGTNDGGHRRPWLDMPRCQSCHTGDALNHLSGANLVMAPDGIRLTQAYRTGDAAASSILATNTRFAEDTHTRFRFSSGHGDVLCEGCHGSTHAIWPNADAAANDNVAATQIQGHAGTLIECTACHKSGTVPLNLNGPHGMHVVGDARWIDSDVHGEMFEGNKNSCRTCHGASLQGTPLSKAAATRTFTVEDHTVTIPAGTQVRCNHCHSTPS